MIKFVALSAIATLSGVSIAQNFTLTSLNARALFEVGTQANGFGPGVNLIINGEDVLFQQGYWVKINGGFIRHLDDFVTTASQVSADRLDIDYFNAASGLRFNVRYLLTGSGATSATLAEVVTVRNTGSSTNSIEFFQFNDFDLRGAFGDVGTRLNSSTIQQRDGLHSVTVGVTGIPDRLGMDNSFAVFSAMNSGTLGSLAQNTFGPQEVAFAFQWNTNLAPGDVWQMSSSKIAVVPEPMTMTALGLGLAALARRRRKG